MYEVLVYIHIVCAILWVGSAALFQVLGMRAARASDPTIAPWLGRTMEWIGMRVSLPASIILFVAGVIMVAQRWSFGQAWISISMGLWILSALAGSLYLGPRTKKLSQLVEAEGPSSPAALTIMTRLNLVARLELLSFAVIIALMVWKPGA